MCLVVLVLSITTGVQGTLRPAALARGMGTEGQHPCGYTAAAGQREATVQYRLQVHAVGIIVGVKLCRSTSVDRANMCALFAA